MGFITPQGHLMASGTSSNPGVTFSSPEGWGIGNGPQPGQPPAGTHHHRPHTSPTLGHFPPLFFKKAFAGNAPEQIELELNKAVVICKLEMIQRAPD